MKTMTMMKMALAASAIAIFASTASAQDVTSTRTTAQSESTANSSVGSGMHRSAREQEYPSGFNSGRTQSSVEGCVGPVSYCNIYFGG
jgi:hypothetical protein